MFYFFDGSNNNLANIENALKYSESYYSLFALGLLESKHHSEFTPFNEISLEQIKKLVENLTAFFVLAFDGEGYLMWIKDNEFIDFSSL